MHLKESIVFGRGGDNFWWEDNYAQHDMVLKTTKRKRDAFCVCAP